MCIRARDMVPEGIPIETPPIPATRLEHVALAVPDLDSAIAFFSKTFGLVVSEIVISHEQGVRMAYVDLGNAKLELMEPVGDASPIAKFVSQNPSVAFTTSVLKPKMLSRLWRVPVTSVFASLETAPQNPAIMEKSFFFCIRRIRLGP